MTIAMPRTSGRVFKRPRTEEDIYPNSDEKVYRRARRRRLRRMKRAGSASHGDAETTQLRAEMDALRRQERS